MFASLHGLAVVSAVTMVLSAMPAAAQSLGDVARQEQGRRKQVSSGKSYTNESLKPEPEPSAPVTPASAASPAPAADAAPAAPAAAATAAATDAATSEQSEDGPKKDEAYWKKRLANEREAASRSQIMIEALQSRINALTGDYARRDDPAQRGVLAADRQKALTELERVKRELDAHAKAVRDIQEEGRRAGVPAGWVR